MSIQRADGGADLRLDEARRFQRVDDPQEGVALKVRIVGPGRAGSSFARAFASIGIHCDMLPRESVVTSAGDGVDAVLICTPDSAIAQVAKTIVPSAACVMHCSGATGLDVLAPHRRRASLHPLMALPDAVTGSERLVSGGWFAISGDRIANEIVETLGGRGFEVPDNRRALYHATAVVASNHLVGLLGQVERLAELVGVPVQPFFDLARGSYDDVVVRGAHKALTGPAARGDVQTLEAHRAVLPEKERSMYNILAESCSEIGSKDK